MPAAESRTAAPRPTINSNCYEVAPLNSNCRKATPGDWNDIYMLVDHSARSGSELDWELLQDYMQLFNLSHQFTQLKERYVKIAAS